MQQRLICKNSMTKTIAYMVPLCKAARQPYWKIQVVSKKIAKCNQIANGHWPGIQGNGVTFT